MDPAVAVAEVRAVYAAVDARPVQRDCVRLTECCQFKLSGSTPMLTKGEAMVAARGLRAAGRTRLPAVRDTVVGTCPMLDVKGKCIIYRDRPFGCRTHFCAAAGGPYARREVIDLIRRLEVVDAAVGGEGTRALGVAVEDALAQL